MRKIKTFKIFESKYSKEAEIKDYLLDILMDIKSKLNDDLSVSYSTSRDTIFIELNDNAATLKGSDSDHEDTIEFILDESDVSDLKSAISYLEQEGYTGITLCISRDDEDNFEELDDKITIEQAKKRLDNITNVPIEYMEIRSFI
jgi:hypothetical protein